jgi:hypothetical protein
MVEAIFRGETMNVKHDSMTFTYDDLLKVKLKLILPTSIYKYNNKYEVYEDMREDEDYMEKVYDKAINLKIVGIVTTKEGVTAGSMDPVVVYRQDLIDYIIDESAKTDMVKKQLKNKDIDVFSGNKFDDKKNTSSFTFADLVSVDEKKLASAFDIKIDQNSLAKQSETYINNINNAITSDINPALTAYNNALDQVLNGFKKSMDVDTYLGSNEVKNITNKLASEYYIPGDTYKTIYKGVLNGVQTAYNTAMDAIDKVRDTSTSHERCSIIEVMGRGAGYIALWCGIANGAEDVLLPERYDYDEQKLVNHIIDGRKKGKQHHIIINAEGIGHSVSMAKRIESATGIETRASILGHMQRGGAPTAKDRVYASTMGALAVDLLCEGKTNRVVGYRHGEFMDFDIDEALAMRKDLDEYQVAICEALGNANYYKNLGLKM